MTFGWKPNDRAIYMHEDGRQIPCRVLDVSCEVLGKKRRWATVAPLSGRARRVLAMYLRRATAEELELFKEGA